DCVDGNAVPLTQEFLGEMLGVRRTTVTIAAQLLQSAGLIRYRRGRIQIVNRPKLENLSCECYAAIRRYTDRIFPPSDGALRGTIHLGRGCPRSPAVTPWRRWQRETGAPASRNGRSTVMPRYYFHIEDDRTHIDQIGVELPDIEAARDEAVGAAGQILRNGA